VPALRQLLHSYYIAGFQLPALPELLWRSGLLDRAVATSASGYRRRTRDRLNGLQLYRANIGRRPAAPARHTDVPVQVLAPRQDAFVTPALQLQAPLPYASRYYPRPIAGRHWVVADRPEVIAAATRELVASVERGQETPTLTRSREAATRRGDFAGELVMITGAGSGIGRETAYAFARAGADLLLADIDEVSAKATADHAVTLGVRADSYALDVADAEAWQRVVDGVVREHGVPDVLVNNAGIGMAGPFLSTSPEDWDRIIAVNLRSVITGSQLIAERMLARGYGGRIVNIASAAAYSPSKTYPAYATTKAAVLMLTECLRAELAPESITVTAICPGFIDTNISATTAHVGLDAEAQAAKQAKAVRSYHRRNYSPRRAAAEIVAATATGQPIKYVTPEALGFLVLDRFLPAAQRAIAKVDLTEL
jgi:NAD(P)-dependent dehydrogenase (short-subunit alcohol dehydrogenase family)